MACSFGDRPMTEPVLALTGVNKSFGGLQVCTDINLEIVPGEIHALIGPNGAGKTTLLSLVSGLLPMDSGAIFFNGQSISHASVDQRARAGMARSFQITSLFTGFTVQENMALAVQATQGSSYRFWKPAANDPELTGPALEVMARIGLAERADVPASALSHGEQRLLEIGMALATRPDLLLLDEPMAGLGPGSARYMSDLIMGLKEEMTLVLVEHDMEAVFTLADRITVLVEGRVIATDSRDAVRKNPAVQQAYLGPSCWL